MITIISQPSDRSWSNNDLIFRLKATDANGNVYGEQGVIGRLSFDMSGAVPSFSAGDTVTIAWMIGMVNYSEVFTAIATPTSINHIPAGFSDSFGAYFKRVLTVFQSHPRLSSFFKIKGAVIQGYNNIEFVAKEISDDWSITMSVSTSANIAVSNNNTVQSNPQPTNYKVKLEVLFQDLYGIGSYNTVLSTETIPDVNGVITLNIKDAIHKACLNSLSDPPIPPFGLSTILVADNRRKYYIRYAEASGDPITVGSYTNATVKEILTGGIDKELFSKTDFLSTLGVTRSFLTWYPDRKEILPTQNDFISWYNYTTSAKQIVLQVRKFTASSELAVSFKFDTPQPYPSVQAGSTGIIPISAALFELDSSITHFSIRVVDASSSFDGGSPVFLSEERFYQIDYKYYEETKQIVYLNSFFLPEVVKLTGRIDKDLDIDRELSSQILEDGYKATDKEISQHDFDWENVWTYRTGYLTKPEVDALQQMLIYNYVYEITQSSYRALIIRDKSYNILVAFRFLHSLEFKATRALKSENYSNDYFSSSSSEIEIIALSCPVSIVGRYFSYADAQSAGVSPGQFFALLEFAGVVVQFLAPSEFYDDAVASNSITSESCYPVSSGNPYGLPRYAIRKLNPSTSYNSDAQAASGTVAVDGIYYAGTAHNEGVPFGTALIRKN